MSLLLTCRSSTFRVAASTGNGMRNGQRFVSVSSPGLLKHKSNTTTLQHQRHHPWGLSLLQDHHRQRMLKRMPAMDSVHRQISSSSRGLFALLFLRGGAKDEAPRYSYSTSARPSNSSRIKNDRRLNNSSKLPKSAASHSLRLPRHSSNKKKFVRSFSTSETTSPLQFSTNLNVSVSALQGRRDYMEDEFLIAQDFAAVFDGHGGPAVSQYCRQNLFAHLQAALPQVIQHRQAIQQEKGGEISSKNMIVCKNEKLLVDSSDMDPKEPSVLSEPTVQDYCIALRLALDKVDQEVQRINHWSFQGSTALAAWFHHEHPGVNDDARDDNNNNHNDTSKTTLIVANVGDSRAIHGINGTATALTRDHKPDDPDETERIESVGGRVIWCGPRDVRGKPILNAGIYRVNGNLALSRAIGDRSERPAVSAVPDITYKHVLQTVMHDDHGDESMTPVDKNGGGKKNAPQTKVHPASKKEYVVLATDGLYDVFTNQNVVDIIDLLLDKATVEQRPQIAEVLAREAIRRGAFDNITVIIIWLNVSDGLENSDLSPDHNSADR